ncbi:MAG: SDR family NAD(P)-dependent oxidoreductase [Clostridiales bacterium]|nr:SDR family NAD(P)-dependent oxidoreductase [Clostridiales bacterium]
MSLETIVKISNKYGANPDYVLAGGGNTSYKDDQYLYIKGSGTTLATIKADGFVRMDRAMLSAMLDRKYSEDEVEREREVLADLMEARCRGEEHKRPSVETLLHNLFSKTYVVHLHPALSNGLCCGVNGEAETRRLFGSRAVWVPITKPGYILALAVGEAMRLHKSKHGKDADIVILQNHGIFVAGDDEAEIDSIYDFLFSTLDNALTSKPDFSEVTVDKERAALVAPALRMLLKDGPTSSVTFRTNKQIADFVKDEESFYPVSSAYTPDHIVYCRPWPLFVKSADNIDEQYQLIQAGIADYKEKHGFLPRIVAIQGLGIFAHGAGKKQADICADVFLDTVKIGCYTNSFGGPLFMTEDMIDFIVNWEVEAYRSKVSLTLDLSRRLDEKIAIVTGSAQGFGLGIAEGLCSHGANVVMADLNYDTAAVRASELESTNGKGSALPLKVDVSDEKSVQQMIWDTVLCYGGLDLFVSNAGVVKAGSLEEMTLKNFEFVTKINYTAFFLCVKYASRIMKIQHKFDNSYMSDIVQINSKSGLEGSNKNFAYAGGKFGGIGLVQSFALELCSYNIKVNAICPGNLLTGPLWSDPERGLFVQYLKAGKVPGAKTVEDVRRHYELKVPMGRGCEIVDVLRAVLYVVEQEYETGQAIPVTGGQCMLK